MLFDIDGVSDGIWFDFQESTVDEDGKITFLDVAEGAGSMCIRQADAEFFDKLYKKTRKKVVKIEPNRALRNSLERIEYTETLPGKEGEEREALIDHWISDYKRFKKANGDEIPVTKENKIKLMKIGSVRRFVDECHRRISSDGGLIKEQIENL